MIGDSKIHELVKRWLAKANEDLLLCEREFGYIEEEILIGTICFHCQQAVEKYLKAFLIFKQIPFQKTHNIEHLRELCSLANQDFNNISIGHLSSYAVDTRYPDELDLPPTLKEAQDAFEIAKNIRDFVMDKLKNA